jgi:predicted DNA repair protein MutK
VLKKYTSISFEQAVTTIESKIPSKEEVLTLEKRKIKAAIVTDFILSVEIVIIALGSVEGKGISTQIIVVTFIAFSHRRSLWNCRIDCTNG